MEYNNPEDFARTVHKGQKYGDGKDYADAHLSKVVKIAKILSDNNSDIATIAWLHDTIEDTAVTFSDLDHVFGLTTAVCVLALTRNGTEEQYLEKLKHGNYFVKIVKLADILANLSELRTYRGNALKYATKKGIEIEACLDGLI